MPDRDGCWIQNFQLATERADWPKREGGSPPRGRRLAWWHLESDSRRQTSINTSDLSPPFLTLISYAAAGYKTFPIPRPIVAFSNRADVFSLTRPSSGKPPPRATKGGHDLYERLKYRNRYVLIAPGILTANGWSILLKRAGDIEIFRRSGSERSTIADIGRNNKFSFRISPLSRRAISLKFFQSQKAPARSRFHPPAPRRDLRRASGTGL